MDNVINIPKPSSDISLGNAAEDLKVSFDKAASRKDPNPWERVAERAWQIFSARKLVKNEPDDPKGD